MKNLSFNLDIHWQAFLFGLDYSLCDEYTYKSSLSDMMIRDIVQYEIYLVRIHVAFFSLITSYKKPIK